MSRWERLEAVGFAVVFLAASAVFVMAAVRMGGNRRMPMQYASPVWQEEKRVALERGTLSDRAVQKTRRQCEESR